MKTLSIIIPAYNMEKYIENSLDSMIRDGIMDLLEVIVIDDGSTDKTVELVQKYVDQYPQTFKVISKENGGHGSALNTGIEAAKGKYIRPIDGDDWVNTDSLEYIVKSLKGCNADMVVTHFKKVLMKSNKLIEVRIKGMEYETEYSLDDVADYAPWYLYHHVMYRADILKNSSFKFSEHCFYDDMEYDSYPLLYVKTVLFINRYLYSYRLEREGQSVEDSGFIRHRDDRKKIISSLCRFWEQCRNENSPNVANHLEKEIVWRIKRQYEIYLSMPKDKSVLDEIRLFDELIKSDSKILYDQVNGMRIKLLRDRQNMGGYIGAKCLNKLLPLWRKMNKQKNRLIRFFKKKLRPYWPKPWDISSDIPMHLMILLRLILKRLHLTALSPQMRELQKFKDIHKGERCFITCTGPSMTISDLELLNDEITFGVNSITKAYEVTSWRPTYYVLVDVFAFGKYLRETEIEGKQFCHKDAFFHYRANPKTRVGTEHFCLVHYGNHTKHMMKMEKVKISKELDICVYDCFTVTNMAIQIAMYMGFKQIYIIGADCNYTSGPIHFIEMPDDKAKIATGRLPNATRLSIIGYEWVKKYADEMGVEIFNATRGGMLEVFPRVVLEDILRKEGS